MEELNKIKLTSCRYKLLIFVGMKVARATHLVNFTPPGETKARAIGFAWSASEADNMVANYTAVPPKLSRANRRAINRAAKKAVQR